jgi:hypothetical protein
MTPRTTRKFLASANRDTLSSYFEWADGAIADTFAVVPKSWANRKEFSLKLVLMVLESRIFTLSDTAEQVAEKIAEAQKAHRRR